jgi:hypothetical protein
MQTRRHDLFTTIQTEGAILPADLLRHIADGDKDLEGLTPESYHLSGEKLNEAINRSWNRLTGAWAAFRSATTKLGQTDLGTTETRERWLLPLFEELKYGRLPSSKAVDIEGKSYPISHAWQNTPIHLVGCRVDLDRRAAGVKGAAQTSPHGLVQEFLNRSKGHLWGFVSNGYKLRILRDNVSLTRQAYVEFDLQAMMDGEVYSDFVVLWLLAHQSRVEGDRPELCWLEKWSQSAQQHGTRALDSLRDGVEEAIKALGSGFLAHPDNKPLREKLRSGTLDKQDYYRQLLRNVYRLLFLFVAEDRSLLLDPKADATARDRYTRYYSTGKFRHLAERRRGTQHADLWRGLSLIFTKLGDDQGCPALALPALGSFLWSNTATPDLTGCDIANHDLLFAIRSLAFTTDKGVRRAVDYKNLGSEELGSIYESLLELHPQLNLDVATFELSTAGGNERKTTGSHYTPTALVIPLLESALDPVLDEACKKPDPEKAILRLKVCDPASGSGHFLIAAAHRIAKRLAFMRSGDAEPSPEALRTALRDVIGHCLYGVDINPISVELCKISLWMEALEPGKPLSFLDHHIRTGNSLLGTTPELIAAGIPNEAFTPIEGDDKAACSALKKLNNRERAGYGELFVREDANTRERLQQAAATLESLPDGSVVDIHRKEAAFQSVQSSYDLQRHRFLADTWCAAFVIRKGIKSGTNDPVGITQRHITDLTAGRPLPNELQCEVEKIAADYQFFHWYLAFPEVFAQGGFDLNLGNPPWETLSPDQREFFGKWISGLRSMSPEEQQQKIEHLLAESSIAVQWAAHCRYLFALVHFLKDSGVFTLFSPGNLGKGDFNIYRMFVELALRRLREGGYACQVVPAGLYGGANASAIRKFMFDGNKIAFLAGCENKGAVFFPGVHPQTWFALYSVKRGGRTEKFRFTFGVDSLEKSSHALSDAMELDADVIRNLSPETYAIPDVRNLGQLATSRKMYAACPAFGDSSLGPPLRHYSRELDMGNDRDLFTTDPAGLPVYEGRMIDHFDHRAKTYASGHGNSAEWIEREFGDPAKAIVPQWRVLRGNIPSKLGDRCDHFRIGFGDIANPRNERSFTATLIPPGVICGHKVPTFVFDDKHEWAYLPWLAVANSFGMDWLARCRLSAPTMSYTLLNSLPFPRPATSDEVVQRVAPIVLRLVCTTPEMTPFWNQMARLGFVDSVTENTIPRLALTTPDTRAIARAELDAFVAVKVFGLTRQELSEQLDTFDVLRRRQEKAHGEFRTKRLILEALEGLDARAADVVVIPAIPRPDWMDRPMVLPSSRRVVVAADRYRATLVPHLLYQAGGSIPFERFRKAYWLLTEPKTLERYATGAVGPIAQKWWREFRDTLHKDMFIEHLKGAVGRQLHFVRKGNERWLELRDPKVADDEHVIFDARLALLVADLWPEAEPIAPLVPADEIAIQELEAVL